MVTVANSVNAGMHPRYTGTLDKWLSIHLSPTTERTARCTVGQALLRGIFELSHLGTGYEMDHTFVALDLRSTTYARCWESIRSVLLFWVLRWKQRQSSLGVYFTLSNSTSVVFATSTFRPQWRILTAWKLTRMRMRDREKNTAQVDVELNKAHRCLTSTPG